MIWPRRNRRLRRHLADQWEEALELAAGGPAHEVDAITRLRAVVISQSNAATKAELRSRYLVKVLADGLWGALLCSRRGADPEQRKAPTDQILQMLD